MASLGGDRRRPNAGVSCARAAELIRERNRELSVLESLDTGKPLQETLVADAASGADCLEYFAGLIPADTGQHIDLGVLVRLHAARAARRVRRYRRLELPDPDRLWKAAPALAAGNAMIFKPSEVTPLSALKLAEILTEAGLPDGVFNVVQGAGEVGAALAEHPGVAKVSVTGSVRDGRKRVPTPRRLAEARDARARRQVAADRVRRRRPRQRRRRGDARQLLLLRSGLLERHPRVRPPFGHDEFVERLVERTEKIALGDPLDEDDQMGPLVS